LIIVTGPSQHEGGGRKIGFSIRGQPESAFGEVDLEHFLAEETLKAREV